MSNIVAFVKRHPALAYFGLMFAISWGSILVILGGDLTPAVPDEMAMMGILYVAMMAGPSIAGILLIGLVSGRSGLREFLSRLVRWRVGVQWYAVAVLTTPVLATASLLALSLFSPDFIPRIFTADDKGFVIQFGVVSGVMVALAEELGWTGFAVPTLRRRYGVITTGLIVGIVIAVWHMLLVYWMSRDATGDLPIAVWVPAVTLTWLPAYRVLMTWVYDHTESIFVAIVMHAGLMTFWYILTPLTIAGPALAAYYVVFSAAVWVLIGAIVATNRRKLSRPLRPSVA